MTSMIGTVERIQKNIEQLEETLLVVAREIHQTCIGYITAVAEAVERQALQASYQVCTRGFPSQFLALSVPERQTVQQALRELIAGRRQRMPEELSQAMQAASLDLDSFQDELETVIIRELKSLAEAMNERLQQARILSRPEPEQSEAGEVPGVHLRLSEIEFSDRAVMSWRSQLRVLSARLARLQRELAQQREEKMVADAEAAWRSTWPQ